MDSTSLKCFLPGYDCDKLVFYDLPSFATHISKYHRRVVANSYNRTYECRRCQKRFDDKANLENHLNEAGHRLPASALQQRESWSDDANNSHEQPPIMVSSKHMVTYSKSHDKEAKPFNEDPATPLAIVGKKISTDEWKKKRAMDVLYHTKQDTNTDVDKRVLAITRKSPLDSERRAETLYRSNRDAKKNATTLKSLDYDVLDNQTTKSTSVEIKEKDNQPSQVAELAGDKKAEQTEERSNNLKGGRFSEKDAEDN